MSAGGAVFLGSVNGMRAHVQCVGRRVSVSECVCVCVFVWASVRQIQ